MIANETIYRSILLRLSAIPADYLQEVDSFLENFTHDIREKKQNREKIMRLAGAWNTMSEEDFQEYLQAANAAGNELFNRDVEL